jgi:hypothetical protein
MLGMLFNRVHFVLKIHIPSKTGIRLTLSHIVWFQNILNGPY